MTPSSLYLYAVVRPGGDPPKVDALVEPSGGPLGVVETRDLAALVSPFGANTVRPLPKNLRAHEHVVDAGATIGPVIPFRFGLVSQSAENVRDFLGRNDAALKASLDRFDGAVEWHVIARWAGDAGLREVMATSPRIRNLRARARGGYHEQIALGEAVASALGRLNLAEAARLEDRFGRVARATRRLTPRSATTVLRAAYLVENDKLPLFDELLTVVGDEERHRIELELVGPLAPWDFAELDGRDVPARRGRIPARTT